MRLVIVGAGPAGLTVAETVRQHDTRSSIAMVTPEPYPPYAPPAMADHFLNSREQTLFWRGRDVCDRLGIDFHPGVAVSGVRPAEHRVALASGETLAYDALVVASGSRLYAPVPGADLDGISNFKSLRAAETLVQRARSGEAKSALIVGAGFIGVEVALVLRDLGLAVTIVEALDRVMPRMLDPETAGIVQQELTRRGVELRLDTRVAAFVGDKHVDHVTLEDGTLLRADVYVAATGVKPNLEMLDGAGVDQKWGILVDDHLRTNVPGIYAAGDVAETVDRMTGERYVHAIFPNAVEQARIVGLNLLGYDACYAGAESMNSLKHVGLPVIAVGAQSGNEQLRYRDGNTLRKLFLSDNRIVGFRLAGDISSSGVYRSLMLKRADVTPFRKRLVEPGFGVADVAYAALSSAP